MKYAPVYLKNRITGSMEYKCEAVLLNCMDKIEDRSFWELKYINDMSTTRCHWVDNSKIYEK